MQQQTCNVRRTGAASLDGRVDGADYALRADPYGQVVPPGSWDVFDDLAAVDRNRMLAPHTPEPLTLLGVGLGVAGAARYLRRRVRRC